MGRHPGPGASGDARPVVRPRRPGRRAEACLAPRRAGTPPRESPGPGRLPQRHPVRREAFHGPLPVLCRPDVRCSDVALQERDRRRHLPGRVPHRPGLSRRLHHAPPDRPGRGRPRRGPGPSGHPFQSVLGPSHPHDQEDPSGRLPQTGFGGRGLRRGHHVEEHDHPGALQQPGHRPEQQGGLEHRDELPSPGEGDGRPRGRRRRI